MLKYKQALLSENCTNAAIYEFPDLLTSKTTNYGNAAIAAVISAYLFVALAIVCADFLVPAIERLCYEWKIPYNIAGATFLAAGTSMPEFFVNMVGTFITHGDIGVGTIVGSSVFNSLAITACVGFCGASISIDWWPLTRDIFWYFIAIIAVTLIIEDNIVMWYESLTLTMIFLVYLLAICCDTFFQKHIKKTKLATLSCFVPTGEVTDFEGMETDPMEDEEPYKLCTYPCEENCWQQFIYLISWPLQLIFCLTIPNCRYLFFRKWYLLTLLIATLWISLLSYMISWMLTVVGYVFNIPDTILGITFLAAGTSIPEAVSSVIVTRKGYGSMAVCNAVGSNTVDILICLGLPWLAKALTSKPAYSVALNSHGLAYDSSSLIITGVVLYITFMATHFTLGIKLGVMCTIVYIVYVVFACMIEMNVFSVVNLPTCPDDYSLKTRPILSN